MCTYWSLLLGSVVSEPESAVSLLLIGKSIKNEETSFSGDRQMLCLHDDYAWLGSWMG